MGSSFKCTYLNWIDDIKMLTSAFTKRQMFAKNKYFYIWKWHFTPRFQGFNPWILENYQQSKLLCNLSFLSSIYYKTEPEKGFWRQKMKFYIKIAILFPKTNFFRRIIYIIAAEIFFKKPKNFQVVLRIVF